MKAQGKIYVQYYFLILIGREDCIITVSYHLISKCIKVWEKNTNGVDVETNCTYMNSSIMQSHSNEAHREGKGAQSEA